VRTSLAQAIWVIATIVATTEAVEAGRLDDALEASAQAQNFVDLSAVPAYQYALRAGGDTGNYSLDAIANINLARRNSGKFGSTNLVMWVNSVDKIGGLYSAPELADQAGLLWNTTDIGADSAITTLLVLAVEQWFFDDRLSVGLGKFFPGQFFLLSDYTADNSNNFTNKMISGNPVASFWESIGLGVAGAWYGDGWTVQAGMVDAQATADGLDFSSFSKGKYAYMLEFTYEPGNRNGTTSLSAFTYLTDAHDDLTTERGLVGQFTHEFGEHAEYATFGRYTVKSGGTGKTAAARNSALPVEHGGFVGVAWNQPFGRANQQLAAAALYGQATSFNKSRGFNNQYGAELYWKFRPRNGIHVTPSVQFLRNRDDNLETVVGLRVSFGFDRNWSGPIFPGQRR
jgi:carbohydrate-selective porin OprB